MGKIISVINQKGGVGKTTISFNIAIGLVNRGYRVLVIDNDPQGNLTSAFLADPTIMKADVIDFYSEDRKDKLEPEKIRDNLYLIGANIHLSKITDKDLDVIFGLKEGLSVIEHKYDFVIIDCLPSFGYLSMAALNAANYVLIPIKPAPFALAGLKDLIENMQKIKRRFNNKLSILGILLNLVEGRSTIIGEEIESILRRDYKELVFNARISRSTIIEESPVKSLSAIEYSPRSKQASQFKELLDEMLEKL